MRVTRWLRGMLLMSLLLSGTLDRATAAQAPAGPDRRISLRADAESLAAALNGRGYGSAADLPVSPEPAMIDSIHRGLLAIWELDHPARDSVFEMYDIRAVVDGVYDAAIGVDSLAPWLDAWTRGEVSTGTVAIDSVLGPLDVRSLELSPVAFWGDYTFVLRFTEPVSWWILNQRLTGTPGVEDVGLWSIHLGGGNYLSAERADGAWRFRFAVGWGDCPSGCIHRHTWVFDVDADGARLMGILGEPLPPPGRSIP